MAQQPDKNYGRRIGGILRSTLNSGDLSRLKELGPAIEDAVKDISAGQANAPVFRPPAPHAGTPAGAPQPGPYFVPRPAWQGSGPYKNGGAKGMVRIVLGVIGLFAFGVSALVFAAMALVLGGPFWGLCAGFGVAAAASTWVLCAGLGRRRLTALASSYRLWLAEKPVLAYDELAALAGRPPKQLRREVRRLQKAGMLNDVRTDDGETCLIRGEEAWRQYRNSLELAERHRSEEEARRRRLEDPATAGIESFRQEGEKTIRQIRQANSDIPGEEISEKLDMLEGACARIFHYVDQHPEKLSEIRRFMNYYLPTTLKLVEKYRQYEQMDYQPENVRQAKAEIEQGLAAATAAFGKLLESLYQTDVTDVSTDIEVMQRMLVQEGLAGEHFEIDKR